MVKTTSTERSRKFRANLKDSEEQYEDYKKKDRERKQNARSKEQLSTKEVQKKQEDAKLRQRVCRQRKRRRQAEAVLRTIRKVHSPAFKSRQSFGKAVSKAKRSLPGSPRKFLTVIRSLASQHGFQGPAKDKQPPNPAQEKLVTAFYSGDDISRQAPGMKDFVVVRGGQGGKAHVQKRHLYMTVSEVYQLFINEYPDEKIGKSKFASLRPQHVLTMSNMPHDVCLCMIHENMALMLEACKDADIGFPKDTSQFIKFVVCDETNEDCMLSGDCGTCGEGKLFQDQLSVISSQDVKGNKTKVNWYQWQTKTGGVTKTLIEGTIEGLVEGIHSQLPQFLRHCFIKRKQSAYFTQAKETMTQGTAVVQVDFSENYEAIYQDETQSAHWAHSQVTVFTSVAWFGNAVESYAIVSDYLGHDKYSVYKFLQILIEDIKSKCPGLEKLIFFSDGAASQFKQKFLFVNLTKLKEIYSLESLEWNFFATSHGKGAVDGVGGTTKRVVWHRVLARQAIVKDAESFASVAAGKSKITIFNVPPEDIEIQKQALDNRFEDIRTLVGTQGLHQVLVEGPFQVKYKAYSTASSCHSFNFQTGVDEVCTAPEPHLEIPSTSSVEHEDHTGKYLTVRVAGRKNVKTYACLVIQTSGTSSQEVQVRFMKKVRACPGDGTFVFSNEAESWVSRADIVTVLPTPDLDKRDRYVFPKEIEAE